MNQPQPTPNDRPSVADLLIDRIQERKVKGIETYGVALQPFNGRNALEDGLEEAIDLTKYLLQEIEERRALLAAVDEVLKGYDSWVENQHNPYHMLAALNYLRSLRQQLNPPISTSLAHLPGREQQQSPVEPQD